MLIYKGTASMKNVTRLALLALLVVPVLVAAGCGGSEDVPTGSVAVVDGTDVSRADLDALMERAQKSYAAQKQTFPKAGTAEYQSLQEQAVAYLVQRVQYEQEAEKLGITVTAADIAKRNKQVLNQAYFGGSQKKLDAELKKQGYTKEQYEADLRALAIRDKVAAAVVKEKVKIDDAAIKANYQENLATKYTVADSREVRHILLSVHKKDGSVDYAASKAQAEDVRQQLENGADFATLAKKYSQDPGSKDNGGKYTVEKGKTVAPFEKATFSLGVHELSQPVKTEYGYHLIEALGPVKPGHVTPLAQVRNAIKQELLSSKQNDALTEWAAELKKKYEGKIEYAAGFEPTTTEQPETTTTAQD
jgi:parvulin-like peptidyl-prolyl isomerase